jgi:transcriptional regulator with XRE-family HTH domain
MYCGIGKMKKPLSKAALKRLDVSVGKNIKACRISMKMSQSDVAKQCDLSFQQIQKYETGANGVRASRLLQLCAALNATPLILLYGSDASEVKQ